MAGGGSADRSPTPRDLWSRVPPHHFGVGNAPVSELHSDDRRRIDDMVVGDDAPVGIQDHA